MGFQDISGEFLGGVVLGTLTWWGVSRMYYEKAKERLGIFKDNFNEAEKDVKDKLNTNSTLKLYNGIKDFEFPKYGIVLDPVKYFSFKKKFSDLKEKSEISLSKLESI